MKIRCALIGDGSSGNPFRSPFPTSITVDVDYVGKTIIVDIPDVDVPDNVPGGPAPQTVNTPAGMVVTGFSPAFMARINARLDERYPNRPDKAALQVK